MKRKIILILCIIIFLCSACSKDKMNKSELSQEQTVASEKESAESIAIEDVEEDELSWPAATETEGKLYQNLNLDGVGESDDEVYVSIVQYGDYEDKVTAVRIHLGTGETLAQIYPVYGYISLMTGKVFSEEKDAIILEIQNLTSNYGAATVYVLDVYPADTDPIPEVVTRLDTTDSTSLADGTVIENSILENNVTSGTELVDVSALPRQGIRIYFLDNDGNYYGLQRIFYWTDDGWTVVQIPENE